MKVTVETTVNAPTKKVWRAYTASDDIKQASRTGSLMNAMAANDGFNTHSCSRLNAIDTCV